MVTSAEEEEFCEDYLAIDAKEASLYDIACIFVCSIAYLNTRKFFEERCKDPKKSIGASFRHRWLLFVSVVMQLILFIFRKPMAFMGFLIENWLNLLSTNEEQFLDPQLAGEVAKTSPDRFMSIIAQLDKRLNLDESIRKGDGRYNASLAMIAAQLAYEKGEFVERIIRCNLKMEFIGCCSFWNDYQNQPTTHASMFQDPTSDSDLIVVAFKGTGPFDAENWMTDLDIAHCNLNYTYDSKPVGSVHHGFMKALGLHHNKGWPIVLKSPPHEKRHYAYYEIRRKLKEILQDNENAKFIVTGHSLGGALAILFVGVLGLHQETWLLNRLEGVYTFGQPRVGDECFGRYMIRMMKDHHVKYFRYVYCNDMVPRLPYDDKDLLFKHFGETLYYSSFYNGKVMEEEPNKNYFSLVWAIPKYVNAYWEFMRSFILPYWKGKDYKEEHIERLFRIVGLIIPGLSAHGPKDYVDVTRLGTYLVPNMTSEELVIIKD